MADLGDAIYAILSGNTAVSDAVNGNIFPDEAPRTVGNIAYIVFKRISGVEDFTMDGSSNLCQSRVQIDCVAPDYPTAKSIYAAVFAALQGYKDTIGGVTIKSCFESGKRTFVDPSPTDETLRSFGRSADYMIWHTSA